MAANNLNNDLALLDAAGESLTIPADVTISGTLTVSGTQTETGTQTFSGTVNLTGTTKTDSIAEYTSAAGVTIDGCLIKDGRAAALATGAMSLSAEITGNGSSQDTAHGLGATPTLVFAIPSNLSGGVAVISYGTHDATNAKVTMTTGEKYRVVAFK